MADLKVCDKCGAPFNARGDWQSLQLTTFKGDPSLGPVMRREDDTLELGPCCMFNPREVATPKLALTTTSEPTLNHRWEDGEWKPPTATTENKEPSTD